MVDNASTDASLEIARGYGAKVLENHTNQGLSRAINTGVAATGAPWLLIVNPDTWLSPGSVRRLLATATSDQRIGCRPPPGQPRRFRLPDRAPVPVAADRRLARRPGPGLARQPGHPPLPHGRGRPEPAAGRRGKP